MPQLWIKNLELNKKWWHRLIIVLFVIFSIIWIILAILISDWYLWRNTFFYILLWTMIRIVVANLLYYEWIIYIITWEHWWSFLRKIYWYYNNFDINKKNKILKISIFIIGCLILLRFVILPIVSNKISDIWNTYMDKINKIIDSWTNIDISSEQKKARKYCKIWIVLHKSVKSLRCMWRSSDNDYTAESYFLKALNLNPKTEEEIKMRVNLANIYFNRSNDYQCRWQIDILFSMNDLKDYPDIVSNLYYLLGYIAVKNSNLSDAVSMMDKAWERAKNDIMKFRAWIARSDVYIIQWNYLTALSTIISMQKETRYNSYQKEYLKEIESKIRKQWNLYNIYNN